MKFILVFIIGFLSTNVLNATITNDRSGIAQLYVATFNRAADAEGLQYWVDSGLSIEEIAQSFFDQPETQSVYNSYEVDADMIIKMYNNLFNRTVTANDAGVQYWLNSNIPANLMTLALINGALNEDRDTVNNKGEVSLAFADTDITADLSVAQAYSIMQDVSNDYTTVQAAIEALNSPMCVPPPNISPIVNDINFTVLHSSQYGNSHPAGKTLKLLQSQSEYENELYRLKSHGEEALDINFDSYSVALIDLGSRGDTSYHVEVPSVYEDNNGEIHIETFSQEMDILNITEEEALFCNAGDAMTNPFMFIKIPKTELVYFDDNLQYYDCQNYDEKRVASSEKLKNVNFTILENSDTSGFYDETRGKVLKVILSQEDYENEMAKYSFNVPNTINFEEYSVALVSLGYRTQIDYSLEIPSVYKDVNNNLHITVLSKTGQGLCAYPDALSEPYVFIQIPKSSNIYFDEQVEYYQCDL